MPTPDSKRMLSKIVRVRSLRYRTNRRTVLATFTCASKVRQPALFCISCGGLARIRSARSSLPGSDTHPDRTRRGASPDPRGRARSLTFEMPQALPLAALPGRRKQGQLVRRELLALRFRLGPSNTLGPIWTKSPASPSLLSEGP